MTRPRNFKPGEKWPEKWSQNEWSNLKEQPLNLWSQAQRDAAYDVGFQAGYDAAVADMQAVLDKNKPRKLYCKLCGQKYPEGDETPK